MAVDYPDYQTYVGLTTAITNLQAAINALIGGFGTNYQLQHVNLDVTADGALHTIVPAVAGKAIVVIGCHVNWDVLITIPRGYLWWGLSSNSFYLGTGTLSPESPSDPMPYVPGGMATPINTKLECVVSPIDDTATARALFDVWYYLA